MKIDNFPDRFARAPGDRSPSPKIGDPTLVYFPEFMAGWTRRYPAVEYVRDDGARRYSHASIEADGLVNQISIVADTSQKGNFIFVGWYAGIILQGMIVAEWFRRWGGQTRC